MTPQDLKKPLSAGESQTLAGLPLPFMAPLTSGTRIVIRSVAEYAESGPNRPAKSSEKTSPHAGAGLVENGQKGSKEKSKEKILRLMAENPIITMQELAESLGLSLAGIEKIIRILKQQGRLRRVGPDKGGHWEVLPRQSPGK